MAAPVVITIVGDLERQGVRLRPGRKGIAASGKLSCLTPVYREALRSHGGELEALILWRDLQDESEAKFGHPAARLYPFLAHPARNVWKAPLIRTPRGEAHLAQVMPDHARVVLAMDVAAWRELSTDAPFSGKTVSIRLADVWPPVARPNQQKAS